MVNKSEGGMTLSPFISVITPTLNRAFSIERTIRSVLNQDYPAFEHIVVDGLSTDHTMDILSKYPHLKIFSFKNTAIEAQNKGIEAAKGDLICFIHSDDYLLPQAFRKVEKFFQHFKEYSLFCGSFMVEEEGKLMYKAPLSHNILDVNVLAYGVPGMSATFFKRDLFKKFGNLRHDLTLANDRGFIADLLIGEVKSVTIPHHLMVYLKHADSVTINNKGRLHSTIIQEHLKLSQELSSRTSKKDLKKFFQSWHVFEKVKEILLYLKEGKFKLFFYKMKNFCFSQEIKIFIFYSLFFYCKAKINLKYKNSKMRRGY